MEKIRKIVKFHSEAKPEFVRKCWSKSGVFLSEEDLEPDDVSEDVVLDDLEIQIKQLYEACESLVLNESQNDRNDGRTEEPTSDSDIEILDIKQESNLEASSMQAENEKIGGIERIDVIKQECNMKQTGILEYLRKKWYNNFIFILDLQ